MVICTFLNRYLHYNIYVVYPIYLHCNSERHDDLGIHHISIWAGKREISISTKGGESFTLEAWFDNIGL